LEVVVEMVGGGAEALRRDPICGKANAFQLPLHKLVLEHQLPLLPLRIGQVLLQDNKISKLAGIDKSDAGISLNDKNNKKYKYPKDIK